MKLARYIAHTECTTLVAQAHVPWGSLNGNYQLEVDRNLSTHVYVGQLH
jgi:hypothetical protein